MSKNREVAFKFHEKLQKLLARKAKHFCMFPGCRRPAIHAHSISKEHALREVAEDGRMYWPEPLRNDEVHLKEIKFKLIGIQDATTFKGFCPQHDSIFNGIDTKGITTYRDVFLQLYRSLASELFIYAAYRKSAHHAGDHGDYNEAWENSKSLSTSRALVFFHDLLIDFPEAEEELPRGNNLELSPFSNATGIPSKVLIRRINFECPLALHQKFSLHKNGNFFDTFVFVIPSASGAMMIILCRPEEKDEIFSQIHTDIGTLNFIESCMISDGRWWLAPSVIDGWSQEKRQLIESDYWAFQERGFMEPYDISILDLVRQKLCETLPSESKKFELAKIHKLPNRENIFLRNLNYLKKVETQRKQINSQFPDTAPDNT